LLALTTAGADPTSSETAQAPLQVAVRLVGSAASDPVLAERITSWFDPARFRVDVSEVRWLDARRVLSPEHGAIVYVWVTLRERNARLYFAKLVPSTSRATYLLRDLPLEAGLDEMGSEQIAQTIHFSTQALLEGQLESPREVVEQSLEAEPRAPSPAPAPSPVERAPRDEPAVSREVPPTLTLAPGFGYGATWRGGAEGVGHGPRISLSLALSETWLFGARFSSTLPMTRSIGPVELELFAVSAALSAGAYYELAPDAALELFAGPGLELVRYAPAIDESAGLTEASAETELRPQLSGGLLVAFGRAPRWALIAEVAIALSDTHYDLVRTQGVEEIGRPWPVMPSLALELRL
jgi:hypothetical protein